MHVVVCLATADAIRPLVLSGSEAQKLTESVGHTRIQPAYSQVHTHSTCTRNCAMHKSVRRNGRSMMDRKSFDRRPPLRSASGYHRSSHFLHLVNNNININLTQPPPSYFSSARRSDHLQLSCPTVVRAELLFSYAKDSVKNQTLLLLLAYMYFGLDDNVVRLNRTWIYLPACDLLTCARLPGKDVTQARHTGRTHSSMPGPRQGRASSPQARSNARTEFNSFAKEKSPTLQYLRDQILGVLALNSGRKLILISSSTPLAKTSRICRDILLVLTGKKARACAEVSAFECLSSPTSSKKWTAMPRRLEFPLASRHKKTLCHPRTEQEWGMTRHTWPSTLLPSWARRNLCGSRTTLASMSWFSSTGRLEGCALDGRLPPEHTCSLKAAHLNQV